MNATNIVRHNIIIRTLLIAVAAIITCGVSPYLVAQESDLAKPTVPLVKTVGCVERDGDSWFLTRATAPTETALPFATFNEAHPSDGAPRC